MDNTSRSVIYAVNSDLDDGLLYAEFETKEAALEYAKRNLDKLPFIDELEVSRDENGDIDNVFSHTTIWSHAEETTSAETEDDYWDDLATMYDEEQANKHDLGDTTWFESMDNLVETLEENEDEVECKECFDLFPKVDCIRVDIGYVCPTCAGHGIVSDEDIFKVDFPEYEKMNLENDMIPAEPVAEVEPTPEVEPIEEVPVDEPTEESTEEPVDENDPVSEDEVEEIEDPEEEPIEEDYVSTAYDTGRLTKEELYDHLVNKGDVVEIEAGHQGYGFEDTGAFSDGGYYSNSVVSVEYDNGIFKASETYMSESGADKDGDWDFETESFDELWNELITCFSDIDLTEDISEDELDAEIEKAKKTLTLAKLNTKIEKQRTKASKQGAKQAKNDLSATKSANKAVKDTSKTDVSTSKDDVKVAKNDLKRAKIDAKRQEVEADSDSSDAEEVELQEHVNQENPAIESDQELEGTDNAVVDCKVADVVTHSEDEKPLHEEFDRVRAAAQCSKKCYDFYNAVSTNAPEKELKKHGKVAYKFIKDQFGLTGKQAEDLLISGYAVWRLLNGKSKYESLTEASAAEFDEIVSLCKEIGIETGADLDRFAKEEVAEDEKLLDRLRSYRAELGDDFEIKETLLEAKRDPFHDAIFEAIDYLTEFSDIFPVPENIGATNWEELKDDINYGLSSDFEIAEIIMEYFQKDLAVSEKHPEIFEDDPQSELTLETYNRLKRAYDRAVADYEAKYPEDFEEQLELKHGWDHIKSVASLVHTAVDNYTKDNRVATGENGTSFYVLGDVTTSDPEKMKKLILDTLAENGYDPDIVRYVTKGNAYGYIIDHIKAMARATMSYQKREGLVEDVNDDVLATNKRGDYLVRNSSGRGYSVFSTNNVWQGGFECDSDEDAVSRFNRGDINESAILAGVATGVIVDVVKRIFDKFGDGKKKSKWIDFRKYIIEKTPEGQVNIWNLDGEQVESDLKTIKAAKEKIKLLPKPKKKKTEPKKDTDTKDTETVTESVKANGAHENVVFFANEIDAHFNKKYEIEILDGYKIHLAGETKDMTSEINSVKNVAANNLEADTEKLSDGTYVYMLKKKATETAESLTEDADEDEIEPTSVDPEEKPSKNVKMANTASTPGMDFEAACQKFGIELN